jgi:hypothetical protein
LLTVVEASKDRPRSDAIADVGAQIDDNAGHLETNLGCDPRLDRAEAKHLYRHVSLDGCDPNLDGAQEHCPRADTCAGNSGQRDGECENARAYRSSGFADGSVFFVPGDERGIPRARLCNVQHARSPRLAWAPYAIFAAFWPRVSQ